jgi:hypothetical protein
MKPRRNAVITKFMHFSLTHVHIHIKEPQDVLYAVPDTFINLLLHLEIKLTVVSICLKVANHFVKWQNTG